MTFSNFPKAVRKGVLFRCVRDAIKVPAAIAIVMLTSETVSLQWCMGNRLHY